MAAQRDTDTAAMDTRTVTLAALAVLIWIPADSTADTGVSAYCQWEMFNASCGPSEIIVMEHAEYGRMRLGRCLTTEVYIGCSQDVLGQMDAKCSGKQTCQLQLPDSSLHQQQPCPNDLMAYMEASYSCLKVVSAPENQRCSSAPEPPTTANVTGVLSSALARSTGYGLAGCPWRVEVQAGQQVSVTLVDFGLAARYQSAAWGSVGQDREYCYVYAIIREARDGKEFTVCAGEQRESTVYVSTTSRIDIVLMDGESDGQNFLLKYQAVGCPDLRPPSKAYVMRQGEGATITCNDTSQAWHLVCKDTEWIGEYGECSAGAAAPPEDQRSLPSYGLILAILIGVAIGVMVGFTLLAGVLYCRSRRRHDSAAETLSDMNNRTSTLPMTTSAPGTPSCKVHRLKGEYGYTHVWEVQRSPGGTTYRPAGTRTPDSAYQSYQSQRGGPQVVGDTLVCFHSAHGPTSAAKRDHDYESPKFETFGVGVGRGVSGGGGEGLFGRPVYQGCGKTCTIKPPPGKVPGPGQCPDSDSVVHIDIGLEPPPQLRAPVGVSAQQTTCYSMAGETKSSTDNLNSSMPDIGLDPRGNHYT